MIFKRSRVKGLPNIYKMSSTKQTMEKRSDDVDDEISDGGRNRVKELLSIYRMSSTKQTMEKRSDDVDASANFLDSLVPDVPIIIMKPSKGVWFKNWIQNAKCKMHEASETIKQRSMEIANWILNKRIVKSHLPAKIKKRIKMETKYSDKPIIHKYSEEKLSAKKITALENKAIIHKMKILNNVDPLNQMMLLNERKTHLLNKRLILLKGIKCNETLEIKFEKLGSVGKMMEKSFTFTSKAQVIMNEYDIESALQNMRSSVEDRIDKYTMEGLGWTVIELLNHELHLNSYDPLAARSYIPLPDGIQNKKATINIKNEDDKCFIYSLGRALDPSPEKSRLDRVSEHLKNVCENLGLNNIKTPVNVQDLPKIETQFNISINLYGHLDFKIFPIQTTKSTAEKHVDLLVTSNSETNHYIWIKNFNRLCYNVTKHKKKKFFCKYCKQHFASESTLQKHKEDCMLLNECQAIEMPPEGEVIKFKSFRETVKIPFVIYADLEALLHKLTVSQMQGMEQDQTEKLQKHVACSYGYKVVCCYDDKLSKPFKMYRGVDSVNNFPVTYLRKKKKY